MAINTKPESESGSGCMAPRKLPENLAVKTGRLDDARVELPREHPIFGLAVMAWEEQDLWTTTEHNLFWTGLLPRWPRQGGSEATRDIKAYGAALLALDGLDREEIADALGIEPDSVRSLKLLERGRELLADMRSVEAAESVTVEELAERGDYPRLVRWNERPRPTPLLPRVYDPDEEEPPPGLLANAWDCTRGGSADRPAGWQYLQRLRATRSRLLAERGWLAGLRAGERFYPERRVETPGGGYATVPARVELVDGLQPKTTTRSAGGIGSATNSSG